MSTESITNNELSFSGTGLLRAALKLDAVLSGANGVAYLALAAPLADLFEVPAGFLRAVGAVLVVFAAAVWLTAAKERPARAAVLAIIVLNALWVVDSIVLLATGAYDPSATGSIWTGLQAAVVAGFAALQIKGRPAL
ncbi:MAG TPA: hypothetical protein VK307_03135 [Thermoleophilaceae bacterium]|nr:hypothetical protein [Thermoleophilaceae bacterium]